MNPCSVDTAWNDLACSIGVCHDLILQFIINKARGRNKPVWWRHSSQQKQDRQLFLLIVSCSACVQKKHLGLPGTKTAEVGKPVMAFRSQKPSVTTNTRAYQGRLGYSNMAIRIPPVPPVDDVTRWTWMIMAIQKPPQWKVQNLLMDNSANQLLKIRYQQFSSGRLLFSRVVCFRIPLNHPMIVCLQGECCSWAGGDMIANMPIRPPHLCLCCPFSSVMASPSFNGIGSPW